MQPDEKRLVIPGDAITGALFWKNCIGGQTVPLFGPDHMPAELNRAYNGTIFDSFEVIRGDPLTLADGALYALICTAWHEGKHAFTLRELCQQAFKSPRPEVVRKARDSLKKLAGVRVRLIYRRKKAGTPVKRVFPLVSCRMEELPNNNGHPMQAIQLTGPPALYAVSEHCGQTKLIPMSLITGDQKNKPMKRANFDSMGFVSFAASEVCTTGDGKTPAIRAERLKRVLGIDGLKKPRDKLAKAMSDLDDLLAIWKAAGALTDYCIERGPRGSYARISWQRSDALKEVLERKRKEQPKKKN